jgi:hypothetical protein
MVIRRGRSSAAARWRFSDTADDRPPHRPQTRAERPEAVPRRRCDRGDARPMPCVNRTTPQQPGGQIGLLLEEYRALRAEIDQRIGARATLVGFLAAGAAFIVGSHRAALTWIAGAVFLMILGVVWGSSTAMLGRIAKSARALEDQINLLAKDAYGLSNTPKLLQWETLLMSDPGWMRRFS